MNSESDQQPGGSARARESAPDPPAQAAPSSEVATPPPQSATSRPGPVADDPASTAAPVPATETSPEPAEPASAPTKTVPGAAKSVPGGVGSAVQVTDVTGDEDVQPRPGPQGDISPEQVREHLRRRAIFLRELAEARELRRRVTPHRSRRARIHAALRRRTFRIN
ncbi:response regulator [Actinomadura soli]|uniref:Response regulator n=1 Tax=Actinomadura soli TaxID=2508997 RepID=A0A5C4IYQ1_9ACTN|nr:response regulator [Actinomadura soli]TMQ86128.1 response regulator [Actinomadura soli]